VGYVLKLFVTLPESALLLPTLTESVFVIWDMMLYLECWLRVEMVP